MQKVFIHTLSDVQSKNIGRGSSIWQYCVVLSGAVIGNDVNICSHCFIENNVVIGSRVTIKNGALLYDNLHIQDDVFIGPNVVFANDKLPRSKFFNFEVRPTLVKRGASIGANCVILPGVIIGEGAMVGAGTVVTKNVHADTVLYSVRR